MQLDILDTAGQEEYAGTTPPLYNHSSLLSKREFLFVD
jgi:hypothetical protein